DRRGGDAPVVVDGRRAEQAARGIAQMLFDARRVLAGRGRRFEDSSANTWAARCPGRRAAPGGKVPWLSA
uniref:hypothetical protein n=1 Tax=Bordetella pertussis TaxID=520 RepID=UPI000B0C482B